MIQSKIALLQLVLLDLIVEIVDQRIPLFFKAFRQVMTRDGYEFCSFHVKNIRL